MIRDDTCPFCRHKVVFKDAKNLPHRTSVLNVYDDGGIREIRAVACPNTDCGRVSVWSYEGQGAETEVSLLSPRVALRPSAAPAVERLLADAYNEAAALEGQNHVACAIMARRCLEMTLKFLSFKGKNLEVRIDALALDPRASPKLKDQLHRLRHSGNYAVHADLIDGLAVYEVGPHEIDAAFDALDDLFEDFFTVPAKLKRRDEIFKQKDADAKAALAAAKKTA